jgi:predicted permease
MSLRRWLFGRRDDLSQEVRDEIRFYLEMRAREFEEEGLDEAEAWRAAVAAFGDPEGIRQRVMREATMRSWIGVWVAAVGSVAMDTRIAARSFRREPAFSLVAVVTLALGIGGTTAIFSVARRALLVGPPVASADRLVAVYTTSRRGFPRSSSSYPDYVDYRGRTSGLADLAATSLLPASLGDEERGARLLTVQSVSGNYFELLGLAPAAGRLLAPADDVFGGGSAVTVLSHELWQSHFGGDPEIVGRAVRLNGTAFEVVGVAPAGYEGLRIDVKPELWVPMQTLASLRTDDPGFHERFGERGTRWIDLLVGRLSPGATVDAARAELLTLSDRLAEEDPNARGPRSVTVDPLAGYILPAGRESDFRTFVLVLGGTVGLALLLCCANLANLLLARAATRRRGVGVRLAIGAGRARVVRQLVTESLLLAAVGGLAGLGVAALLLAVLGRFDLPGGVSVASLGVSLDPTMLVFAGVVTLGTGLLFGLAPALEGGRTQLVGALRSGSGARGGGRLARVRKLLVALQVGLCFVLLVGSGLFVRTLGEGFSTELGFRPEGLALTRYNLSLIGYGAADAMAFVDNVEERLRAAPGVSAVATSTRVPLQSGGAMGFFFTVDGYESAPDEELRVDLVFTTPGYPAALRLPVLAGRDFDSSDGPGGEQVAIVSRSMAERYWPGGAAVGGTVLVGGDAVRVVGVVENTTWNGLADEVTNYMYVPLAQTPSTAASAFLTVAARADAASDAALGTIRGTLADLDRDVSIAYQSTMEDMVADVLMPQRMGALLLSAFGLLALVLSVVGIAGVVSYAVTQQRREIAVRVALGATKGSIRGGLLASMALPVALGVGAGLLAARSLSKLVEGLLFSVRATDPVTYTVITLGIVAVSVVATLVPARAATGVEPAEALSAE